MITVKLITKRQMFSRVCFAGDVSLLRAMEKAEFEGKHLLVCQHGLYRRMHTFDGWRVTGLIWVEGQQCFVNRWNEEIEV